MTRDEARTFLFTLSAYLDDCARDSDIECDISRVLGFESLSRERCAKIAESHSSLVADGHTGHEHARGWTAAGQSIAYLIRKGSGCYPPQAETK